jgi:hypothetical protein
MPKAGLLGVCTLIEAEEVFDQERQPYPLRRTLRWPIIYVKMATASYIPTPGFVMHP